MSLSGKSVDGGVLEIYGGSDDLLEFEGAIDEEFNAASNDQVVVVLKHENSGLLVIGTYTARGTWAVGLAPLDDNVPMPWWRSVFAQGVNAKASYSALLKIEVPPGTTYREVSR